MTTVQGGYEQAQLAALIANQWMNGTWNAYETAGYYDPWALGWTSAPGGQAPTLARSQLDAQITQWGVQNALQQGDLDRANRALDAQIAQWAQQNALDAGTLTGFYNGMPTLAREHLAATIGIANADNFRQWAQMRGQQLLQQQAQDDQMRIAAADSQLQTLALLASQRGPTNFLAYNSLLNSLDSPDLAARDPFGIAQALLEGVGPRSTVDLQGAWSAGVPGGGVPLPNMTAPAGSPSAPAAAAPRASSGGGGVTSATPAAPRTPTSYTPNPSTTAISGNPGSDQAFFDNTGWANTSPEIQSEFWRISNLMNQQYNTQAQNAGGNPGYAKGTPGVSTEPAAIVGDVKTEGEPNPELLINPTDAPFIIIPMDEMTAEARKKAGMHDMNKPMPHYANGTWGDWWQPRGGASIPGGEQPWQNIDWSSVLGNLGQWGQQYQDWRSNMPNVGDIQNGIFERWLGGTPMFDLYQSFRNRSQGGNGGSTGTGTTPQPGVDRVGAPVTREPSTTTGQGYAPERSGRQMGTPYGNVYTDPGDSYWSRLPDGYNQQKGRLPAFAFGTDTVFGNFGTFSPQQLVDSPLVKKLTGGQDVDLWQRYGGNGTMTLPGTQQNLPGTINMAAFARMAPSERGMTQALYETPRAMGGLGLDWNDILQASTRAAPLGARFSNAGYGY